VAALPLPHPIPTCPREVARQRGDVQPEGSRAPGALGLPGGGHQRDGARGEGLLLLLLLLLLLVYIALLLLLPRLLLLLRLLMYERRFCSCWWLAAIRLLMLLGWLLWLIKVGRGDDLRDDTRRQEAWQECEAHIRCLHMAAQ
jgi:hypothetical protein